MFWPVAQGAFFWAGENFVDEAWLFREYFLDPYVAALVLGLVAGRWAATWLAALGAVANVIVAVGIRETADTETFPTVGYGAAWSAYVEAALPWLWIAGLIALGIALSRRIGGLDFDR
jgi:hypothetical protein